MTLAHPPSGLARPRQGHYNARGLNEVRLTIHGREGRRRWPKRAQDRHHGDRRRRPGGLTESSRRVLAEADLILGASATLRLLEDLPARKVPLEPDMPAALRQVREALGARRPVLVSGGDPLFYGVARYLCDRLGKDQFEVVPHVSSMQLAFARVKESWEDAYLTSLAGRPLEAVIDRIRTAEKVGLFSSDEHPPDGWRGAPGSRDRLLSRLRLRESRLPRRASRRPSWPTWRPCSSTR